MRAPSRAVQLICRVATVALRCAGPSQQLVEFRTAEAIPANPIQAPPAPLALPRGTPDVAGTKNVCNQARSPKRNLLRRSQAFRFARCEMAGDPPVPLLFRAIAKVHEALPRRALEASLIRGHAKIHPAFG